MRYATLVAVSLASGFAHAQLIQPDSAVAGSEFNNQYLVTNAINGSGLPAGFGLDSVHATYTTFNHWTTASGALQAGNAWAIFSFNDPQSLARFHMWNHLSNGVAADPGYAITRFNLELFDADSNLIGSLLHVSALPHVHVAQTFDFGLTHNISSVKITILANNGSTQYTGLAEVAFDAVPAPGAVALLGLGAAIGLRRRR